VCNMFSIEHDIVDASFVARDMTGWIHRTTMKMRNVQELSGCKYLEVTDKGLVIEQGGMRKVIEVRYGLQ
jgi:hypothetical protein